MCSSVYVVDKTRDQEKKILTIIVIKDIAEGTCVNVKQLKRQFFAAKIAFY